MRQLKDRMLMEMRLRNFSPSTIKAYVWYVANFTKHFGADHDTVSASGLEVVAGNETQQDFELTPKQ